MYYYVDSSWLYHTHVFFFTECAEGVMKPNNVSNVSTNQTKWTNSGSKNYITIPVKNEVRQLIQCLKNT